MPRMSMRAYAQLHGVTTGAIFQAVKSGKIGLLNGRVDPAKADATWYRRHLLRDEGRRSVELTARHEHAVLTRVLANIMMTRRKVERTRARLANRRAAAPEVGRVVTELRRLLLVAASEDDDLIPGILRDLDIIQSDHTARH